MYGALDTSTSALVANRTWLNVISANLANKDALLNEAGEYDPYRRRFPVFMAAAQDDAAAIADGALGGVHVGSIEIDDSPLLKRYEPGSPFADKDGYVEYPNVNSIVEQTNAMVAARSYEANITAAEATKSMITVALQLLA